jgi:hypothetical protein
MVLHVAARYGHTDVIQLLCSFGSNPDFQDKVGGRSRRGSLPLLSVLVVRQPGDTAGSIGVRLVVIYDQGHRAQPSATPDVWLSAPCIHFLPGKSCEVCEHPHHHCLSDGGQKSATTRPSSHTKSGFGICGHHAVMGSPRPKCV